MGKIKNVILKYCSEHLFNEKIAPQDMDTELEKALETLLLDAVYDYLKENYGDDDFIYPTDKEDIITAIEQNRMDLLLVSAIIKANLSEDKKLEYIKNLYKCNIKTLAIPDVFFIRFPFHKAICYLIKNKRLSWEYLLGIFLKDEYSDPEDFMEFGKIFLNDPKMDWYFKVLYFLLIPILTEKINTRKRSLLLKEITKEFFNSQSIELMDRSKTALLFINKEHNLNKTFLGKITNLEKEFDLNSFTEGELFLIEIICRVIQDSENTRDSNKKKLCNFILKVALKQFQFHFASIDAMLREIAKNLILIQEIKDAKQFIGELVLADDSYVKMGTLDALYELKYKLPKNFLVKILEKARHSKKTTVRKTAYEYLFVISDEIEKYIKYSFQDKAIAVRQTLRTVALSKQKFSGLDVNRRAKLIRQLEKSAIPLSKKQKASFLKFKKDLDKISNSKMRKDTNPMIS